MELANRFHWVSVSKYDDEFRLLQARYNYPWSFDSNHLQTFFLEPFPKEQSVARWVLVLTLTPFLPLRPLLTMGTLFALILILKAVAPSLTAFMYMFATAASLGKCLWTNVPTRGYSYISAIQQPAGTPSQWLPLSNYLLNQDVWLREFQGHEDKNFLADGIVNGFQLADIGTTFTPMDMQNYKSATSSSTKARVGKTIREEIMQGNYVITSSKPTVVNALGAIPMPNSTEYELFTIFLGFIGRLWTTMLLLAPLNFNGMTQLSWLGLNT